MAANPDAPDPDIWVRVTKDGKAKVAAEIADLIQQRQVARQQRNYATADQICDHLAAVGVTVVDQPNGAACWHR